MAAHYAPARMRRRSLPHLVLALVATASIALAGGCSKPATYEPSPPTADFRPKVLLVVDDAGIRVERGERDDPALVLDPLTVKAGTVMRVENRGTGDHRIQATPVGGGASAFDTGSMRPGETTIVVLDNTTGADRTLEMRDLTRPDSAPVPLTVAARL